MEFRTFEIEGPFEIKPRKISVQGAQPAIEAEPAAEAQGK